MRTAAWAVADGFVTYGHLHGASDLAIAHQTRHRSLATLGGYVRVQQSWVDIAATPPSDGNDRIRAPLAW